MISANDQAGELNDKLVLTLNVAVSGVDYSLSLNSEIRSIRIRKLSGESALSIMQGLSFSDLSKEEVLALAAFELLSDWEGAS